MIDPKYKLSGEGLPVTTNRDMTYKDGVVIPSGTPLWVYFTENKLNFLVFDYQGKTRATRVELAYKTFGSKFKKAPSMKSLERMSNDGVVTTPTGFKVEPDGTAEDGSASWLLILGYI